MIGVLGGGIFASTQWLLFWNGGGAVVAAVPGVPGMEWDAEDHPDLARIRLHWEVPEE